MVLQVVLDQTSIDLSGLAGSARVGITPWLRPRVRAARKRVRTEDLEDSY